uniref:Ethylene-and jasmonate-responsive plant defensin n=1 Tax=Flammulina velutipes TaxID=38945 RepID=A0A1B2U6Y5_FLAVE|nr:ethylene- and jasmonate-responsive plant defensin [Flammulina velutipes]
MPPFNPDLLGACNKGVACPEQCGFAYVAGKEIKDYTPVDKCSVCSCLLGSHMQTPSPVSASGPSEKPFTTNRVDPKAFGGSTTETLKASRGNAEASKSFHASGAWTDSSKSPFRQASQHRTDNRRKAANGEQVNAKFDPSEEIVAEKLANKTGRPVRHAKKKASEPLKAPEVQVLEKITVILIPETAAGHAGTVRRPSGARYDVLRRPENEFVRDIQVPATAPSAEIVKALMEKFSDLLLAPAPAEDEPQEVDPVNIFHIMDIVSPARRGPASMLVVNQWVQDGKASFSNIKAHFTKSQPSGIKPSEIPICLYIILAKTYEDLSVHEPKAPASEDIPVPCKKRSAPAAADKPAKKSKTTNTAPSVSPVVPEDVSRTYSTPAAKVKKLEIPPNVLLAKRKAANTYSPADKVRIGEGYAGSAKWSTLTLTPPYDLSSAVISQCSGLLQSIKVTALAQNPDLAAELVCSDTTYLAAFAPFEVLGAWLMTEEDPSPQDNFDFVRSFKLGPFGILVAADALLAKGRLLEAVSILPGLSASCYAKLLEVSLRIAQFGSTVVQLVDFFTSHVERHYWFPLCGPRQLEAVMAHNRPLMSHHLVKARPNTPIHTGLQTLGEMLRNDATTSATVRIHLKAFAGSADDARSMAIDILEGGHFGLDLLLKTLRFYVVERPIHDHYQSVLEILGKFCEAVAWKLSNVLKRPGYYHQRAPAYVPAASTRRNPATGNFERSTSTCSTDTVLEDAPSRVDSEWYLDFIMPDDHSVRSFFPANPPPSPSAGNTSSSSSTFNSPPGAQMSNPLLLKAYALYNANLTWTALLHRLRSSFAHPVLARRQQFEATIQASLLVQDPAARETKQWRAAQLLYHADKNTTVGPLWKECHDLCSEARFIITSFPNAELAAVERVNHQLYAIRTIIHSLDDPYTSEEDIESMLDSLDDHIRQLDAFIDHPPPPPSTHLPRTYTGSAGRPAYTLDTERLCLLHDLGNSWTDIAKVYGVDPKTIYNHLRRAGVSSERKSFTDVSDEDLDEIVAHLSMDHPFIGSTIMMGHLESMGIHLPRKRIQASLKRVDAMGVLTRWRNVTKRRVYKVRGSNALWHQDGHEKLKFWGFWVHGCVDGHSRLIVYMECRSNKRSDTVQQCFLAGVEMLGWPSRVRGDFGTENNGIERVMVFHWGEGHRAYLRGRSTHNVCIERLWVDIQKDSLEAFRQIFLYLERNGLWSKEDPIHCLAIFLVFQPRIQASLNRAKHAWNHHQIRTAHNRTPVALYELSREQLRVQGVWTGDVGDDVTCVDGLYGVEGAENGGLAMPPVDPSDPNHSLNDDADIEAARAALGDFDFEEEDGNWGIDVYCKAVLLLQACNED